MAGALPSDLPYTPEPRCFAIHSMSHATFFVVPANFPFTKMGTGSQEPLVFHDEEFNLPDVSPKAWLLQAGDVAENKMPRRQLCEEMVQVRYFLLWVSNQFERCSKITCEHLSR